MGPRLGRSGRQLRARTAVEGLAASCTVVGVVRFILVQRCGKLFAQLRAQGIEIGRGRFARRAAAPVGAAPKPDDGKVLLRKPGGCEARELRRARSTAVGTALQHSALPERQLEPLRELVVRGVGCGSGGDKQWEEHFLTFFWASKASQAEQLTLLGFDGFSFS